MKALSIQASGLEWLEGLWLKGCLDFRIVCWVAGDPTMAMWPKVDLWDEYRSHSCSQVQGRGCRS